MKEKKEKSIFNTLNVIDVNDYTEVKNKLTYLPWTYAWAEVKKIYLDASYCVERFDNNKPYLYDDDLGYMVFTRVTIKGETKEMWLPVMDGANKAMKNIQYTYNTRYGEKSVEPATMFDINKAIMRCLVKNIAMFGLGLYIYSGEDLPEQPEPDPFVFNESFLSELEKKSFNLAMGECVKNNLNEEQKSLVIPVLIKLIKNRSDLVKLHGIMNADQRAEYEDDLKAIGAKYPKQ